MPTELTAAGSPQQHQADADEDGQAEDRGEPGGPSTTGLVVQMTQGNAQWADG
jgi:hypothetical protein